MEGNGGRRLAWIAIALSAVALVVSLGGRMGSRWQRYFGQPGQFGPQGYGQMGPQQGWMGPGMQQAPAAPQQGPNYQETVGSFLVTRGDSPVTELNPAKRLYIQPRQPTTEAGIHVSWRGDLYAVLGDAKDDGGYAVRLYFNPLVRLIWLGCVVMFIGGALSLSDRRLRIGAPVKARRGPAAVPAE